MSRNEVCASRVLMASRVPIWVLHDAREGQTMGGFWDSIYRSLLETGMNCDLHAQGIYAEIAAVVQNVRKREDIDISAEVDMSIASDEIFISWAMIDYGEKLKQRCRIRNFIKPHSLLNSMSNPQLIEGGRVIKESVNIYNINVAKRCVEPMDCDLLISYKVVE